MTLHLSDKDLLLRLVAMLEELLDDVIAKDVLHQLQRILLELAKHALLDFAVGGFELLLDKARAMLVSSKLNDVALDVSQFPSLALLLLPLEVGQLRAHGAQDIAHVLFAGSSGWLLLERHDGSHVHVLRNGRQRQTVGQGKLVWERVLQLCGGEHVLKLLLVQLAGGDVAALGLLRYLESG